MVGRFLEGDFDLVDGIVSRLVDPRMLAGRADKEARKEIRQRRVVGSVRRRLWSRQRELAGSAVPRQARVVEPLVSQQSRWDIH